MNGMEIADKISAPLQGGDQEAFVLWERQTLPQGKGEDNTGESWPLRLVDLRPCIYL